MVKELPAIANVKVKPEKDHRLVYRMGEAYGIFGTFPLTVDMIILNDRKPQPELKTIEAYVGLDDSRLHAHTLAKRRIKFPDGKYHYIQQGTDLEYKNNKGL